MIVMGIDPGSNITGYGVISCNSDLTFSYIASGVVRSNPKEPFTNRLKNIYTSVESLVEQYQPQQIAFEDVFYSRNVKAALQLGQARGAALIAALNADIKVFIYAPREIKQALTGSGNAAKEQVRAFVQRLLKIEQPLHPLDVSDALAVAICHHFRFSTRERLSL